MGILPFYVNAEKKELETLILTKKEGAEKLKENNTSLRKLYINLATMNRSYDDLIRLRNTMEQSRRAYESFGPLYEKEQNMLKSPLYIKQQNGEELTPEEQIELSKIILTPEEIGTLAILKKQFGPVPRPLTPKEEFEMFIRNKEFPWYAMQGGIENFKRTQMVVNNSLESASIELYNGIIQMKEGERLQEAFYEKALKDYEIVKKKYELGMISDIERKGTEVELNKIKLQLEQFKRQIENMEMQYKGLIGVEVNREIIIKQDKEELKFKEIPLRYEEYLNKAFRNRAEIKNAEKDLDVKQREFNIIKNYFISEDFQWQEASTNVLEKVRLIDDARKKVEMDIQKGYIDLCQKREEVELAKQKLVQIEIQYENILNTYEAGLVGVDMKWNVELGKIKSEMDYKLALLNYNNSLRKMELASGLGPAYEGQGGR